MCVFSWTAVALVASRLIFLSAVLSALAKISVCLPFLQECLCPALPLDLVHLVAPSPPEETVGHFDFLPPSSSPGAHLSSRSSVLPRDAGYPSGTIRTWLPLEKHVFSHLLTPDLQQVWTSHLRSWLANTSLSLGSRISRKTLITLEISSRSKKLSPKVWK